MPAKGASAATLAILVAVLAALAAQFYQLFQMVPMMSNPGSGTPWAPHSDALGPWLDGGLAYLFGLQPPGYLYRPTVGLFWGSLLTAFGRVEMIPVFFLGWLFALAAAVVAFARDRALRDALLVVLAFAAIRFPETWDWVRLNVDFAALVLTVSGMVLVLWHRGRWARSALFVGCACLGIAAAIRGPFMLAGPIVIAVRLLLLERAGIATIAACALVFVAPLVVDVALQRQLGVASNGLQALFCVYTDPSHGWTTACGIEYHRRKPLPGDIFREFAGFLASVEGRELLLRRLEWRAARDLRLVHSPATFALVLGVAALASRHVAGAPRSVTPFVKALAVVVTLALAWHYDHLPWIALAWIAAAGAATALFRSWRAFACLAAYLAGSLFLTMAGLLEDRLQYTFGFVLVMGIAFFAMEDAARAAEAREAAGRAQPCVVLAVAAALAILYAGSFVLPSKLRDTYLREVYRKPGVALKIGDDPRIDRSLYYTSSRQLIYTRHDALEVGAVRRYSKLGLGTYANLSFVTPNVFVD